MANVSNSTLPLADDEDILAWELAKFQTLHDHFVTFSHKLETCLVGLGLFGNTLAFATLMRSKQMRTPSFVYHKTLVLAYLIYCTNFLIVKCVNGALTIPSQRQQLVYSTRPAAYYSAIVNRVISSVCGYLALYTSLAISIDRFLALAFLRQYPKFNQHYVSYLWITFSLILSACVHSWAPWLENGIETVNVDRWSNRTMVAYRHRASFGIRRLKPYLVAKDWYNLTLRFGYALLLIILTWTVIGMFTKQMKKRRSIRNVSRRQIRRERSLFYLMVAVVMMAYIQVIPRESKRVLELIYPPEYIASNFADSTLSIETRRRYMLFGLYAYTFTTPILNLCTIIERSLLFYFYFALNHSFRKETLILLRLWKGWRKMTAKLGLKKDSANNKKGWAKWNRKSGTSEIELCLKRSGSSGRSAWRRKSWWGSSRGSESSCSTMSSMKVRKIGTGWWTGVNTKRGSTLSGCSELSSII